MGDIFMCTQMRLGLVVPRTCCSCICQHHCIDTRCALPCDALDVPCLVNLCFVNCCYNWRPTFHCTWYAPLLQFVDDYEGEKYTIGRILGLAITKAAKFFTLPNESNKDEYARE